MMYRTKDRQIGDDYNLVKAYTPLAGDRQLLQARFPRRGIGELSGTGTELLHQLHRQSFLPPISDGRHKNTP